MGRFEDFDYPEDRFDLAVCNRILQHIPDHSIAGVVAKLCDLCRLVYVNELTSSDDLHENYYMVRHDYQVLFSSNEFDLLEEGLIGKQTYSLYGPVRNT